VVNTRQTEGIESPMTDLDKPNLRFGPFEVDLDTRELKKSGVRLKLGGQPLEILVALLERPGQLVSREELRQRLWSGDTFVDFGHGLSAAVNKLREALSDSVDEPRYIETLPRRGYRFIGKLAIPEAQQSAVAPAASADSGNRSPRASPGATAPDTAEAWKGTFIDEEWQATIPVKRQTLVNLWILLPLAVVLSLAIAQFWAGWPGPRSPEEKERALKLAAEHTERAGSHVPSIWRADMARTNHLEALTRVISNEDSISGPQPSPDGRKLAYMAGSNYSMEVWVCNPDGSSPKKLTNMGNTGTPRWSPDSRWLAFDSDARSGHSGIYVVAVEGGPIRRMVENQANNSVPSWSGDGKWIYFASNGAFGEPQDQVWKVSFDDGRLAQLTRQGGFSGYESLDGQTFYYAKSRYENPEIWQVPVNGGTEKRVSALLRPTTWASWALAEHGILFLSAYNEQASDLQYFTFADRSVRSLATLEKASFWLSASKDGSSIWYSELTDDQARLVFKAGLD
jgi:DNA-binding winged helix-turn-helix (wHTH) protein